MWVFLGQEQDSSSESKRTHFFSQ